MTDLDISLPVLPNAEEQETVANNDVKTATEGEVVNPTEWSLLRLSFDSLILLKMICFVLLDNLWCNNQWTNYKEL